MHSAHYDKTKRQRGEALPLKKVLDYGESDRSLYLLSSCVEDAEGRLDEKLAIAEELASVCVVVGDVVKTCRKMPLRAVVLYAQRFKIVGVERLVAMHCTKSV